MPGLFGEPDSKGRRPLQGGELPHNPAVTGFSGRRVVAGRPVATGNRADRRTWKRVTKAEKTPPAVDHPHETRGGQ